MLLTNLTNAELLQHALAQHDELTSTPVETELLRRFGQLADEAANNERALDALANAGIEVDKTKSLEDLDKALQWFDDCKPDTYRPLFEVLTAKDIDDADTLKKILERDAQLPDVLADLADPLAKLNRLANLETTPA